MVIPFELGWPSLPASPPERLCQSFLSCDDGDISYRELLTRHGLFSNGYVLMRSDEVIEARLLPLMPEPNPAVKLKAIRDVLHQCGLSNHTETAFVVAHRQIGGMTVLLLADFRGNWATCCAECYDALCRLWPRCRAVIDKRSLAIVWFDGEFAAAALSCTSVNLSDHQDRTDASRDDRDCVAAWEFVLQNNVLFNVIEQR